MKIWAEVTDSAAEDARFSILSKRIADAGVENRREVFATTSEDLPAAIQAARDAGATQIRFGGSLPEHVPWLFESIPSQILTLRVADGLQIDQSGRVWPRNYLHEGFSRLIAADLKDLDLSGAAFIVGANPTARSCVAAIVRVGVRRVNLTDLDEERGQALLEEFRRSYFNVQFQFTRRSLITQLPGVHSIAVNTVRVKDDPTQLNELFYFNFLKSGGAWVEIPHGTESAALLAEARSAGAQVEPGEQLAAHCDRAWVESCFGAKIDFVSYRDELLERLGPSTNP